MAITHHLLTLDGGQQPPSRPGEDDNGSFARVGWGGASTPPHPAGLSPPQR